MPKTKLPDRFTIQIAEKQIPRSLRKQSNPANAEVQAIREKYPELKVLDDMMKGLYVNETDDALFDEYFTTRAGQEGLL